MQTIGDTMTTIAAVWGALLSTVVLVLRWLDRRERQTRLKVKPNMVRTLKQSVLQSTELNLELVNLSLPARAVHPTTLVFMVRRPFVPRRFAAKLRPVPIQSYYKHGPSYVAEGGSEKFNVSAKPLLKWLAKKPPNRLFKWQAVVYDETGERHRSRWFNASRKTTVPAGYAKE